MNNTINYNRYAMLNTPHNFYNPKTNNQIRFGAASAHPCHAGNIRSIPDKLTPEGKWWFEIETSRLIDNLITELEGLEKTGDSASPEEMRNILRKAVQNLETIWTGGRDHFVEYNNTFVNNIFNVMSDTPKSETETGSQYLARVMAKYMENCEKEDAAFSQMIKSKLTYSGSVSNEAVTLTRGEMAELAQRLNICLDRNDLTADSPIKVLAEEWKYKYISGVNPDLPERLERACMQQFERFDASTSTWASESIFAKKPVYRWMVMFDKERLDPFLKQFETHGTEYSYDKLQSCSPNRQCGEIRSGNFQDWQEKFRIKFVIHPQETVSRAYALGEGKYGDLEVVYPKNTVFKYLGKISKEVFPAKCGAPRNWRSLGCFRRWEIHLQEVGKTLNRLV